MSEWFSGGYFVDPKCFLVFRGSEIFYREYFVGLNFFFLVSTLWVQNFLLNDISWVAIKYINEE